MKFLETPKTLLDLFYNINDAIKYELTLGNDFFQSENLKRVFGAKDIEVHKRAHEDEIDRFIIDLVDLSSIANCQADIAALHWATFRILYETKNGKIEGKLKIIIHLQHEGNSLSFDSLSGIFGLDYVNESYNIMNPDRTFEIETNVHGNQKYRYSSQTQNLDLNTTFEFFHDGTLLHASFSTKGI